MKHRAFTLIEMVAVITVGSAITGVGVVMLIAMLKSEGSSRRHLELCKNMVRLDEQFRADVHAAVSTSMSEDASSMELTLPGDANRRVSYIVRPKEIAREEVENGKMLRQESYGLPDEVGARLQMKSAGASEFETLSIEPKEVAGSKIRYPSTRIEAVLAKDLRFEKGEKNEKNQE